MMRKIVSIIGVLCLTVAAHCQSASISQFVPTNWPIELNNSYFTAEWTGSGWQYDHDFSLLQVSVSGLSGSDVAYYVHYADIVAYNSSGTELDRLDDSFVTAGGWVSSNGTFPANDALLPEFDKCLPHQLVNHYLYRYRTVVYVQKYNILGWPTDLITLATFVMPNSAKFTVGDPVRWDSNEYPWN